jgi:hypothetical protein
MRKKHAILLAYFQAKVIFLALGRQVEFKYFCIHFIIIIRPNLIYHLVLAHAHHFVIIYLVAADLWNMF